MTTVLSELADIVLPKKRGQKDGRAYTPTYNPSDPVLSAPQYRQHLQDLFTLRSANDSRTLLNDLVNHDSDVSSAVHSYLSIAESANMYITAYDDQGQMSTEGIAIGTAILQNLTTTNDYSLGYSHKSSVHGLLTDMRYWILLRGMIAGELVLDKTYVPTEIRLIDPATLEWREDKPGRMTPVQKPSGSNDEIDLNIPTFMTERYHQNPTSVYSFSPFVAAINTVAARQDVINELYRIMQVVGYPRLNVSVLEEVLLNNAPADIRADMSKMRQYVEREITTVRGVLSGLTARDAFVHSDAIKAEIINDKNPSSSLGIERVIDVLDNQNQAALKVMPAVIGKASNATTASTESRLFALSADAINRVCGSYLSKQLTLAARLAGFSGKIVVVYRPVELRPEMELEPQLTMRGSRLRQELSLGTITDDEYHMEMFGRPAPLGAPELSGTNFLNPQSVEIDRINPNDDSLGRSLSAPGSESAESNEVASGEV